MNGDKFSTNHASKDGRSHDNAQIFIQMIRDHKRNNSKTEALSQQKAQTTDDGKYLSRKVIKDRLALHHRMTGWLFGCH